MNKEKVVNLGNALLIIIAFFFTAWSYYERVEAVNYFISFETVFLLLFSVLCFLFYLYSRDKLLLLITYILLIQAVDLAALNFKNVPFADLIFHFVALLLFILNALLKILLAISLLLRLKNLRKKTD